MAEAYLSKATIKSMRAGPDPKYRTSMSKPTLLSKGLKQGVERIKPGKKAKAFPSERKRESLLRPERNQRRINIDTLNAELLESKLQMMKMSSAFQESQLKLASVNAEREKLVESLNAARAEIDGFKCSLISSNLKHELELNEIKCENDNVTSKNHDLLMKLEMGRSIALTYNSYSKDKFLDHFKESCKKVGLHHFIYEKQKRAIANLINVEESRGTVAVMIVDYAQNYTFIQPNEVATAHWNHTQATILPFVMYYFCPVDKKVKTEVFTVISNGDVPHDATTFHVFRHVVFTEYMKIKFPWIQFVEFIPDGPGSQFKCVPNAVNLANMKNDYGISGRWTYSATGHGKGASDSFSAIAKRLTRLESLRRKKDNLILTVPDMVNFLNFQNRDPSKNYIMVLKDRLNNIALDLRLKERYQKYKPIKGIRQYHEIIPIDEGTVNCRKYSGSQTIYTHIFKTSACRNEPLDETYHFGDFVGFLFNETFMVGMVQNHHSEEGEYEVLFMKKCEKSSTTFKSFDPPKEELISSVDMVSQLDAPSTTNGRVYNFVNAQILDARKKSDLLLKHLRLNV